MIRYAFLLLLTSCVSAPVAPNLKFPEPAKECPKLVMPPIPEDVELNIKGDKVTANAGGDLLVRGYARARSLLK